MKKFVLLFLLFLVISCSPGYYVLIGDYRPFIENGFIFSNGDINQEYTPVGEVSVHVSYAFLSKEVEKLKMEKSAATSQSPQKAIDDIYYAPAQSGGNFGDADAYNLLLKYLYNECSRLGANGCMHLNIKVENANSYVASGMAIKLSED